MHKLGLFEKIEGSDVPKYDFNEKLHPPNSSLYLLLIG